MNRRSPMLTGVALALTIATLVAMPAAAAGTLDQAQEVSLGEERFLDARYRIGQTFTAGLSGTLDQLDLTVAGHQPGDLIVEIHATAGGLPAGPPLATETTTVDVPPVGRHWISVPIDPPAPVSAGTLYAFVLTSLGFPESAYGIGSAPGNLYPSGIGLRSGDGGATWLTTFDTDRAFRTYVTTEAHVPTCNGVPATIYVRPNGRIVGGPDNGKFYNGTLRGTDGVDVMVGTGGNDLIHARAGDDLVCAGRGTDVVEAAAGNDRLFGEAGTDTLRGGAGSDTMTGGRGPDAFNGGPGSDTATDFNPGEGDTQTSVP